VKFWRSARRHIPEDSSKSPLWELRYQKETRECTTVGKLLSVKRGKEWERPTYAVDGTQELRELINL
jgi:hypothetical protein